MIGLRAGLAAALLTSVRPGVGLDEVASAAAAASNTTLTATIVDSADPTPAGANYTYTLQVTNTGSPDATNLSLTVTLDASLTWVSTSGTGWTLGHSGQTVTATLSTLAAGAANPIVITVTAGNTTATATSSSVLTCDNATTVNTSENTSVVRPTQGVTMVDAADPVIGGNNIVYTVQVTNNGTGTVNNESVTINLDSSTTWVSTTGTGWTLAHPSAHVVTATLSSLAAGAANPIVVTVTSANTTALNSSNVSVAADNAATVTATQTTQVNAVTKDATSGKYCPANSTEWGYLGLTAPGSLWLCGEASGNAADVNGVMALTAGGSPAYQQVVAGWARTAFQFSQAGSQGFTHGTGAPNPTTTSQLWFAYVSITSAPSGVRPVLSVSTSGSPCEVTVTTTPRMRITVLAASATGSSDPTVAGLMPVLIKYDRTNATAIVYTGQEKIVGTYSASVTDGTKGLCGTTSFLGQIAYAALWSGADAEMSDATVKAMLQALGWTITWS